MKAAEIMTRVRRLAQDETSVRWPLAELCMWINDGMREIVLQKPSALSKNQVVNLQLGTYQVIPADAITLLRAIRNIKTLVGDVRTGGTAVTMVARAVLDAQQRDWHDTTILPFKKEVRHVIFDEEDTRSFYVYPGNDGTGKLEAVFSMEPPPIVIAGGAEAEALASYDIDVPLSAVYVNALVDYVLYRAYGKDAAFAGNTQRAALHYQQFANSIGVKVNVEMFNSPNLSAGIKATGTK